MSILQPTLQAAHIVRLCVNLSLNQWPGLGERHHG